MQPQIHEDERRGLQHKDTTEKILACFFDVYNELGPGFLESVYQRALVLTLEQAGLTATPQQEVTVHFRGTPVGVFRSDLVVDGKVVVEIKASKDLDAAHEAQLLNYLKATELEVGLLLNFGPKPQFKRLAFEDESKRAWPQQRAD